MIIEKVIEFLYGGYLIPITFILLIVYFKYRNKINLSKSKFLADFCVIVMFIFSIDIMIFPHRYTLVEKSIMYFKNGESVVQYENGNYEKRNYVNGNIEGPVQFFTKDGFKVQDSYYVDGRANGEATKYFLDGSYEKRNYVNGELQGVAQKFSKDGVKLEEFKYVDDLRSGN